MLVKLISKFGRGKPKQLTYTEIVQKRIKYVKHMQNRYTEEEMFSHQDLFYEEFVYGNRISIGGTTLKNFGSADFVRALVDQQNPQVLILGSMNDNFLQYRQQQMKIKNKYEPYTLLPQKMFCKQRLTNYLQKRLVIDKSFFWNANQKMMLMVDKKSKRLYPQDNYSAGYIASRKQNMKVCYGKPSDIIIFQDNILNFELSQLNRIYQTAIEGIMNKNVDQIHWRNAEMQQTLRNHLMSQQSQIFSKQITYLTSLLKKLIKIHDNILVLVPGYFVERVADTVHTIDFSPQKIFRQYLQEPQSQNYKKYQNILSERNVEEILQKFAILCILKQNYIEQQLLSGNNIFLNSIFEPLFKDIPIDKLLSMYQKASFKQKQKIYQVRRSRINNLQTYNFKSTINTISQQLQILTKREKQQFPNQFVQKNNNTIRQDQNKLGELHEKMKQMVSQEGDQKYINLLADVLKGNISKQGIIFYSKMIGKANIRMVNRVKLPVYHYGSFRGVFSQYLKEYLLIPEDKETKKAKRKMNKMEQIMKKHTKKLKNLAEVNRYISGEMGNVTKLELTTDQKVNLDQVQQFAKQFDKFGMKDDGESEDDEDYEVEDFSNKYPDK